MRPVLPISLLMSAALVAGCGGAGQDASTPATPNAVTNRVAPAVGGQLRIDSTGLHVGDATTGSSSGGLEVLPNTKVPPSEIHRDGVSAGATCTDVNLLPTTDNIPQVVDATLCLLNGERADQGLRPLKDDARLDAAAVQHNADMIKAQYFDHIAPDGTSPVDRIQTAGYIPKVGAWTIGENLAWGTAELSTPKSIVKAWMASTGHRENILNPAYNDIGFGVAVGNPRAGDGAGATYTNTFGGKSAPARVAPPATHKKNARSRKARAARARAAKARAARARAARNG